MKHATAQGEDQCQVGSCVNELLNCWMGENGDPRRP